MVLSVHGRVQAVVAKGCVCVKPDSPQLVTEVLWLLLSASLLSQMELKLHF